MRLWLAVFFSCNAMTCFAAGTPPPPDHPIIGTWKFDVPQTDCSEVYHYYPDGTTLINSGEEVAQSQYVVAPTASRKGFYTLLDTITKDNGKPDCLGKVTPVGDASKNYLYFHPSGDMFLLCQDESLDACIGPIKRVQEQDT